MISFLQKYHVWLIVLVALLLRLPLLDASLWMDEAAQALESSRPLAQQLMIAKDFQPPLLHLILHVAMYVSSSEWWLRLVGAVIPGVITVWATYQIGKKLFTQKVAIISSLLLSTSSLHIFFSQELRPYSLPTMWALLSWLYLIKVITSSKKSVPFSWWLGYTIASIAGIYSSYLYPFLLASQIAVVLLTYRSHLQRFLSTWLLTSLSFLPWLPFFLGQLAMGGQFREQLPGWDQVVSFGQIKAVALVAGKFLFGVINLGLEPYFVITALLILLSIVYLKWKTQVWQLLLQMWHAVRSSTNNPQYSTARHLLLLSIWLVLPLLLAWLVSFKIPVIQPKRVLYLLPAFYLLLGWLVDRAQAQEKIARNSAAALVFGLLLAINLLGTLAYYTKPHLQREDWRGAYAQLSHRYPAGQAVAVFSFDEPFAPWRWYDSHNYDEVVTGQLYIENVDDLPQQIKEITDYKYVITFDYLTDLTDPNDRLLEEISAFGFDQIDILDYPNIGFVRVFAKREYLLTQQPEPEKE